MHNLKCFQENGDLSKRNARIFSKSFTLPRINLTRTNICRTLGKKKKKKISPDVKLTSASIINKTLKRKQSNSIFIEKFIIPCLTRVGKKKIEKAFFFCRLWCSIVERKCDVNT